MSKERTDKELLIDWKLPYDGKRSKTSTSSQTSTAKSESSNTTYQTATIVNKMENKIIYQTRRQTVYTEQVAGITEIITTKHTPTMDELNEMMDLLNSDNNPTEANQTQTIVKGGKQSVHRTTLRTEGVRKQQSGKTTNASPKITRNYETNQSNNTCVSPSPSDTSSCNESRSHCRSRSSSCSSSRSSSSSGSSGLKTPTLITTQETVVTEQNHTTYTENKQEQLIKLNKGQTAQMTSATKYSTKSQANQYNQQSILFKPHTLPCINDASNDCNHSNNNIIDSSNQQLKKLSRSRSRSSSQLIEDASSSQLQLSCCTKNKPSLTINGKLIIEPLLKPGLAYIFNNMIFEDDNDGNNDACNAVRIGSAADVLAIKDAFQYYDLKVTVIDNANLERIQQTVKIIQEMDFSNYSCLAVVVLSHGLRNEEFNTKDDNSYSIEEDLLLPLLTNRTLHNKAKLFFIQSTKDSQGKGTYTMNSWPMKSPNNKAIAVEILKCCSILEGSRSYRNERGSVFIQILSKCLKLYGTNKNIKDIMEMVTNIVKQQTNYRQIPEYISSLTEPFIFGDYVRFTRDRLKPFQSS